MEGPISLDEMLSVQDMVLAEETDEAPAQVMTSIALELTIV